jgi:hypothetical protein
VAKENIMTVHQKIALAMAAAEIVLAVLRTVNVLIELKGW